MIEPRDPAEVERDRQRGIAEDKALPEGAYSIRATLDRPGVNLAVSRDPGLDALIEARVRLSLRGARDLASDLLFMAQVGLEDHGDDRLARRFNDARRVLQDLLPRERLDHADVTFADRG